MDETNIIKVIGRVWDETNTEGKIKLLIGIIFIIGVGYGGGTWFSSYKLEALKVNYERQLADSKFKSFDYILDFSVDSWRVVDSGESQLYIPSAEHKLTNPIVTVLQKGKNGNWQEVGCDIEVDEFSNVIVAIGRGPGFDGRIVLK